VDQNKLRDLTYRHITASARGVDQATADRIVRLLNDNDEEVSETIASRYALIEKKGVDRGPASTKRYNEMLIALRKVNEQAYKPVRDGLRSDLLERAKLEADFAAKSVKAAGAVVDLDAMIPDTNFLMWLVNNTPIPVDNNGAELLGPWLDGLEEGRLRRLTQAIRNGLFQGETTDELVKRIRGTKANGYKGILNVSRESAKTLALTANAAVQNGARYETYKAIPGIGYVEWSSILDSRTSDICQGRSGKVYEIGKPHTTPPAHPRCRSMLIPRRDNKGSLHKPYGEWLDGQSEAIQNDVLGKTRAAVFRNNPDFNFADFFNDDGGYKTLAELRSFDARLIADLN
jgi:SPP1 gp7 family putative phage head morphogenesis protein